MAATKKNNTGLYIGIGLIVTSIVAVGGFFTVKYFIDKKNNTPPIDPLNTGDFGINNGGGGGGYNPITQPTSSCTSPGSYSNTSSFPVKKGQKGSNVLRLQKALNKLGSGLTEDSKFGCGTENKLGELSKKFFPGLPTPVTTVKSEKIMFLIEKIANNQIPNVQIGNGLTLSDLY